MSEYIITDEQAKEIVNQLPAYYVPTWLYLWVHTKYPYEPPNDWIQVREKHIGVNLPEIVRCRDCAKWHYFDDEDGVRYGECDEWKRADSHCMPATREDGYCAWAERKEGGE